MKLFFKIYAIPVLVVLLLSNTKVEAQTEPMYSQYMYNMLSINPAYAGSREVLSMNMFHRKQWVGIAGAPQTTSITMDQSFNDKKVIKDYDSLNMFIDLANEEDGVYIVRHDDFEQRIIVAKAINSGDVEVYVSKDIDELNKRITTHFSTLEEAFTTINLEENKKKAYWPKSPRGVTTELKKLMPALRKNGVSMNENKRSGGSRTYHLSRNSKEGPDKLPF